MLSKFLLLSLIAVLVFLIFFSFAAISRDRQVNKNNSKKVKESGDSKGKDKKVQYKGFINKLNHSETVNKITAKFPKNEKLEQIFNRAKNPWRMTMSTFQFVRFAGAALFLILGLPCLSVGMPYFVFMAGLGFLCFWYPLYFYKATGNERETEWNKSYEFIWVVKHNLMLYDPAKAYLEVHKYISSHAPHNKEIIQGFYDFYKYWSADGVDPYLERFYSFSIPREIYQIVFNMHKTGEFPEDGLNSLRAFIINTQNLAVEKQLSGVSGKATIFSLPFLMVSVIVALMVPLVMQIIDFL